METYRWLKHGYSRGCPYRHQGPVSWRPATVKWRQSSQSNRHSTISTWQTKYHEALPSLANVQSHLTSSFANDGITSWYLVCRVPMVKWQLDCENCRHLTVVGLHDTGPWGYGFTARSDWPGVYMLWLGETVSFMCVCLSVAAHKIFWADCFLSYTLHVAGALSNQGRKKQTFFRIFVGLSRSLICQAAGHLWCLNCTLFYLIPTWMWPYIHSWLCGQWLHAVTTPEHLWFHPSHISTKIIHNTVQPLGANGQINKAKIAFVFSIYIDWNH